MWVSGQHLMDGRRRDAPDLSNSCTSQVTKTLNLHVLSIGRFRQRTFFTMEGGDNKFAKFTVLTLKAFLKVRSQNVSGNKQ